MGLNPERYLSDTANEKNVNTCIFFMVELNGVFRIMYYRVFPFYLHNQSAMLSRGFQTDDCIRILTGSFDLEQARDQYGYNVSRFTHEKIMKATML
jgi:hypothetical protein